MQESLRTRLAHGVACVLALSSALLFAAPVPVLATTGTTPAGATPADQPSEGSQAPLAVTFYAAESEVEGVMSDQVDWSGVGVTLAPCTYTRAGYHFLAWQTEGPLGVKRYEDGATIPAADFGGEGLLQLVALWEPNTYTLRFDLAGGSMEFDSLACTYGEYVTYPVPTRPGYVFKGWTLANGAVLEGGDRALLSTFNGDEVTLTATWEPTTVTIAFDPAYPAGSTGPAIGSVTALMGTGTVSLPVLELDGYDFAGWDNGTGSALAPGSYEVAEAFGASDTDQATLRGVWIPHTYLLACDYAGGTVRTGGVAFGAAPAREVSFGDEVSLPVPERQGYVLAGWVDDAGRTFAKDSTVANLAIDDGATVTLTALWEKTSGTVAASAATSEVEQTPGSQEPSPEAPATQGTASPSADSAAASQQAGGGQQTASPATSISSEARLVSADAGQDAAKAAQGGQSTPLANLASSLGVGRTSLIALLAGALALLAVAVYLVVSARRPSKGADETDRPQHMGGDHAS